MYDSPVWVEPGCLGKPYIESVSTSGFGKLGHRAVHKTATQRSPLSLNSNRAYTAMSYIHALLPYLPGGVTTIFQVFVNSEKPSGLFMLEYSSIVCIPGVSGLITTPSP